MSEPEVRGVGDESPKAINREREAVRALLRSEFEVAPGVGEAFARLYDSLIESDPSVTLDCSRVAVAEGRVIGHALLAPRRLRVCDGVCPGGLVGMVVVHPGFRGRGIATRLIADIHRVAKAKACGLVVLAGDPAFYRRFGYHHAYANSISTVVIPASVTPSAPPRTAVHADVDTLTALSETYTPAGSVVRNSDRWSWILQSGHPGGLLVANPVMLGSPVSEDQCVIDPGGRGYFRIARHGSSATVYEAGCQADEPEFVLEQLRAFCSASRVERLRLRLPSEHPLVQLVREPAGVEPDGEFQFKIVDLDILLEAARPGFEARIAQALPDWTGRLSFRTETERIQFVKGLDSGQWVRTPGGGGEQGTFTVSIPEWGIGRMLLGQDDVVKKLDASGVDTIDGNAMRAAVKSANPVFTLTDAI